MCQSAKLFRSVSKAWNWHHFTAVIIIIIVIVSRLVRPFFAILNWVIMAVAMFFVVFVLMMHARSSETPPIIITCRASLDLLFFFFRFAAKPFFPEVFWCLVTFENWMESKTFIGFLFGHKMLDHQIFVHNFARLLLLCSSDNFLVEQK